MRLINQADIDNAKITMDVFITGGRGDYTNHPSYQKFVDVLTEGCDEATAARLWILLMEGLREKHGTGRENLLETFAVDTGAMGLLSTGREQLALWTGGFDMSRIAQLLGYCTLEKTIMGKALDTIAITSLWSCECKVWNVLSRKFVEGYKQNTAHIYFRIMDETSVLERQEIPQLQAQGCNRIFWHPVYYNGSQAEGLLNQFSEVGLHGDAINISERNVGFSNQEAAGKALQEKIRNCSYKYNEKSFKNANSPFFEPNRAPFAFYG